jgi:hypothetical protein
MNDGGDERLGLAGMKICPGSAASQEPAASVGVTPIDEELEHSSAMA